MLQLHKARQGLLLVHLELLGVVAIWAGTFVATKWVLLEIPPAASALLRYVIAAGLLWLIYRRRREPVARGDYGAFGLLGLTGVTLYYLLQHYGIRYTNATDAALLISLSPAFIGVISWFWTRERIKSQAWLGMVLALSGAALVIGKGQAVWQNAHQRIGGDLLILLTAVAWAVYSVGGKKLLAKYRPLTLIAVTTVIGTVLLAPFALGELFAINYAKLTLRTWLCLLYLGGAASVYGYLAWYRGLQRLPALTVGSYLYFRPLLTGVVAAILLKEQVGWAVVFGGGLIIAGTYLTAQT